MHQLPFADDASPPPFDDRNPANTEIAALRAQLAATRAERDAARQNLDDAHARFQRTIYAVSHELRTPMTSVKAGTQVTVRRLRNFAGDPSMLQAHVPAILEMLAIVQRQVDLQDRLLSDLLDVSRIESDRFDLQMQPQDLCEVVAQAISVQQASFPERTITLHHPSHRLPVMIDATRIGQVLRHLILNALSYSPRDAPVSVTITPQGSTLRVAVRDHGPGLAKAEQQRIWDAFYRVPHIVMFTGSSAALGVGLYLAKSIIAQHGGEIGVKSTPRHGATFWFTLRQETEP